MSITIDTSSLEAVRAGLIQVKDILDTLETDINGSGLLQESSFTPSVLTPTAGTITGGTKTGSKIVQGDLVFFQAYYASWTQNTSTSTYYLLDLPETSNIFPLAISAVDLGTGLSIPAWINSATTARLQLSKTATSSVTLIVSAVYPKA